VKICDKCHSPAVDEIKFSRSGELFDLCLSCSEKIKEFFNEKCGDQQQAEGNTGGEKKRGAGRPPGAHQKKEQ